MSTTPPEETPQPDLATPTTAKEQYTVVARRYRPLDFEQLVGQDSAARGLQKAIETDRVGHAYLFTGARGVGKTSTARILAKALNCKQGPTPQPCGKCDICQSITAGDDIDVLEIDGASNRGIDEVRQLRSNVNIRPSRSKYKIYIIDEVHMLTTQAFNALLKTLEEPPEHVKFIFCTTEPEKIPITVLSRCQKFDFAPVGAEAIAQRLRHIAGMENVQVDDAALATIARRAGGSVRDSQSLLEQLLSLGREEITLEDVHNMLGTARTERLMGVLTTLAAHDAAGALAELDAALGEGVDCGQLAEQLLGAWRDLMAISVGAPPEILGTLGPGDVDKLREIAGELGIENVLAAVQILDEALLRMRQSPHVRIVLETALVRIAKLADLQLISRLLTQLQAGGPLPNISVGPSKKKHEPVGSISPPPHPAERPTSPQMPTSPQAHPGPQKPAGPPVSSSPSSHTKSTSETTDRYEAADTTAAVATMPSPARQLSLTAQSVETVWKEALALLDGMIVDHAAHAESFDIPRANKLVVTFPANAAFNKRELEKPDQKRELDQAIMAVTGQRVAIEFLVSEKVVKQVRRAAPAASNQRQLTRDALSHPMVDEVRQLFDADIVRVIPPRSK